LKMVIKIVLLTLACMIFGFFALATLLYMIFPPQLSQKAVEKDFIKNYDDIMIVTDYLVNSEYEDVWIHKTYEIDTIFVSQWGDVVIDDPQFISTIKTLFEKGYKSISKKETHIKFCRSSTMNGSSGVVYSIDGNEPVFAYLVKLEQLPETNWYYYEERALR